MDFIKQKPIYLQIADQLCKQIVEGRYGPDERVPSVREVAVSMGVNPNTVVRSFEHLTERGIIFNRRGVGYFVGSDASERILRQQRKEFMEEEWPLIRQKISMLGIKQEELWRQEPSEGEK